MPLFSGCASVPNRFGPSACRHWPNRLPDRPPCPCFRLLLPKPTTSPAAAKQAGRPDAPIHRRLGSVKHRRPVVRSLLHTSHGRSVCPGAGCRCPLPAYRREPTNRHGSFRLPPLPVLLLHARLRPIPKLPEPASAADVCPRPKPHNAWLRAVCAVFPPSDGKNRSSSSSVCACALCCHVFKSFVGFKV